MWAIWWYTTSESSYIEQRDIKPQSPEQHGQVFFEMCVEVCQNFL